MSLYTDPKAVFALCATIVFASLVLALPAQDNKAAADMSKPSTAQFHDAMRRLWEDHITWTRLYIVSFAANSPDKDATAQRLLQNQTDIGNAVEPLYGKAAGAKLTSLLKQHILGAVEILTAAKAGNKAHLRSANAKWYANADEIASFLSGANPKAWPLSVMQAQMHKHLDLTLAEATAQLQGNYAASIAGYDTVHNHILMLADTLSSGIVAQFPDKFAGSQ